MAWVEAPGRPPLVRGRLYVRAPRPIEFPSEERLEDRVPETKGHLEARATLYLLLKDAFGGAAIGSDQFVYLDAGDPRRCLAPDVFVKLGAGEATFDNWKIWEHGAPDVAVEIVSAADRSNAEWAVKLERYQASGIGEVMRFDQADEAQPIRVWDRVEGELLERAPESSDLRECLALGLWWVVAPSEYGPMLRLARERSGTQLLLTPSEDRLRLAEELAEERKARTVAEQHARTLAERDDALAENERLRAVERERDDALAERERLRAVERERDDALAERERLRAELARARGPR